MQLRKCCFVLCFIISATLLCAQDQTADVTTTTENKVDPVKKETVAKSLDSILAEVNTLYQEEKYGDALAALDRAKNAIKSLYDKVVYEPVPDLNVIIDNLEENKGKAVILRVQYLRKDETGRFSIFHPESFNVVECTYNPGLLERSVKRMKRKYYYNLSGKIGTDENGKFVILVDKVKSTL